MIQQLEIQKLSPHPENVKIYGNEDVSELAEQIEKTGWVKPLVVTDFYGKYTIVSGHRRHAASTKLGLKTVPCEVVQFEAEWQIIERLLLENHSREKTTIQRTREFSARKVVEAERAKWRFGGRHKQESTPENFPELKQGDARDIAAEQSGFGNGKTAEAAEAVVKAIDELEAKGEEEKADLLKQSLEHKNVSGTKAMLDFIGGLSKEDAAKHADDIISGRKTVTQIKRIIENEVNRAKVQEELKGVELEPTEKKYSVIYADPPWMYDGGKPLSDKYGDVQKHYPPMETADICALPVKDLAAQDCVLFLWATAPKLPEALEVMKSWGFKYKTCIVWDKVKHNFGFYFSVRHELLLIGGIGRSTPDGTNELHDSVISIERSDKHSEKPQYFRKLIEKMYKGEKIELFARQKSQDWDVWGNQA